ncbi:MAG: hypothetical protein R3F31_21540 [Verrucomicrobiales bacterium]
MEAEEENMARRPVYQASTPEQKDRPTAGAVCSWCLDFVLYGQRLGEATGSYLGHPLYYEGLDQFEQAGRDKSCTNPSYYC